MRAKRLVFPQGTAASMAEALHKLTLSYRAQERNRGVDCIPCGQNRRHRSPVFGLQSLVFDESLEKSFGTCSSIMEYFVPLLALLKATMCWW